MDVQLPTEMETDDRLPSLWLQIRYGANQALSEFSAIRLYPFRALITEPMPGRGGGKAHYPAPACLPGMWPAGQSCARVLCHINGREMRTDWADACVRHVWARCACGDVTYSNPSEG